MKHSFQLMLAVALCAQTAAASATGEPTADQLTATKSLEETIKRPASPTPEELIHAHGLYNALTNRTTLLGLLTGWTEYQLAQYYLNPARTEAEVQTVEFTSPNWMSYITSPESARAFLQQTKRLRNPKKLVNADARNLAFSFLKASEENSDKELLQTHGFIAQQTPTSPRTYAQVAASPRPKTPVLMLEDAINQTQPQLTRESSFSSVSSTRSTESAQTEDQTDRSKWLPMLNRLRAQAKADVPSNQETEMDFITPWTSSDIGKLPIIAEQTTLTAAAASENPFTKVAQMQTTTKKQHKRGNRKKHK